MPDYRRINPGSIDCRDGVKGSETRIWVYDFKHAGDKLGRGIGVRGGGMSYPSLRRPFGFSGFPFHLHIQCCQESCCLRSRPHLEFCCERRRQAWPNTAWTLRERYFNLSPQAASRLTEGFAEYLEKVIWPHEPRVKFLLPIAKAKYFWSLSFVRTLNLSHCFLSFLSFLVNETTVYFFFFSPLFRNVTLPDEQTWELCHRSGYQFQIPESRD